MKPELPKKPDKGITDLMKSHIERVSGGFYQVCFLQGSDLGCNELQ